jgi:hypothetical protein
MFSTRLECTFSYIGLVFVILAALLALIPCLLDMYMDLLIFQMLVEVSVIKLHSKRVGKMKKTHSKRVGKMQNHTRNGWERCKITLETNEEM